MEARPQLCCTKFPEEIAAVYKLFSLSPSLFALRFVAVQSSYLHIMTWFNGGLGSPSVKVGRDDLKGLLQPS